MHIQLEASRAGIAQRESRYRGALECAEQFAAWDCFVFWVRGAAVTGVNRVV